MKRIYLTTFLAIILALLPNQPLLIAQEAAIQTSDAWTPIEGEHYHNISHTIDHTISQSISQAIPTEQNLIKFYFWPGSASCYQLESALQGWQQQHPDVKIERIPLISRHHWRLLAKAWLVTVALNNGDSSKSLAFLNKLYQAIHADSLQITNYSELEAFVVSFGIDAQEFSTRFHSLLINQQLKSLQKDSKQFPISGVPTIIINDRWMTDASMANTSAKFISIINKLSFVSYD